MDSMPWVNSIGDRILRDTTCIEPKINGRNRSDMTGTPYTIKKHAIDKNARIVTLRKHFLEQILSAHPKAARLTLSRIRNTLLVSAGWSVLFDYDQTAQLDEHFSQWESQAANEIPGTLWSLMSHYEAGVLADTMMNPIELLREADRFYRMIVAEKNTSEPAKVMDSLQP